MPLIRRNTQAVAEGDPVAATATAAVQPAATPNPFVVEQTQPATGQASATSAPAAVRAAVEIPAAPSAAAPAAPTGALVRANPNAGAVTTPANRPAVVLQDMKDAFTVDYDTFERLKSGAGNIMDANGQSLGDEILVTVMSWQDAWDISPGTNDAAGKEVVRYSNDGTTISGTGQLISEYLAEIRPNFPKAELKAKVILVGILDNAAKPSALLGKTVQISLSQQSRKTWDRYRYDRTLQIQMGKAKPEGAENIRIQALPRKSGTNDWTLLQVTDGN